MLTCLLYWLGNRKQLLIPGASAAGEFTPENLKPAHASLYWKLLEGPRSMGLETEVPSLQFRGGARNTPPRFVIFPPPTASLVKPSTSLGSSFIKHGRRDENGLRMKAIFPDCTFRPLSSSTAFSHGSLLT